MEQLQSMIKEKLPHDNEDENQLKGKVTKMEQLLNDTSSEIDQIQKQQLDVQVRHAIFAL